MALLPAALPQPVKPGAQTYTGSAIEPEVTLDGLIHNGVRTDAGPRSG